MDSSREVVLNELSRNKEGYTISELAKKLKMSRNTISNALAYFEGAGKVKIRQAGMAKLYFIKKGGWK